ncbi:L-threonylcarbamoyladenylate synthase [Marinilabilia salmonicolor]|jgi:L-threonylcarbamoyladenylate synthase|uniref:L-threonylcarbamoyladenylate synthase n=1 Tax=Marinilabilia salmonicolor TaxID=989 RepID=A0A2T0XQK6_9BACT|nr:L-threonylcarbamoyladenylate synthase [Marinilabilia salmonicolor]PRZ01220.1 L-threonylcarbamoyladenylate synthase [Marinilabilia salmonicolor]RCW39383.1 L-threonylcarbamoyladenylate synthase [Marinilabilia salmonicolor]
MNYQEDLKKAVEVLQQGGLILYPTDTFWGIGCDATNAEAVRKVYELKKQEDRSSMTMLVDSDVRFNSYVEEVPEIAYDLIELAVKPLTVIFSGGKNLPDNLLNEDGSIGIRVTKEPFSWALCQKFRKPVIWTSANVEGEASPGGFDEISETILGGVDYVVNYRQDEVESPVPFGIIKLEVDGQVQIIKE